MYSMLFCYFIPGDLIYGNQGGDKKEYVHI